MKTDWSLTLTSAHTPVCTGTQLIKCSSFLCYWSANTSQHAITLLKLSHCGLHFLHPLDSNKSPDQVHRIKLNFNSNMKQGYIYGISATCRPALHDLIWQWAGSSCDWLLVESCDLDHLIYMLSVYGMLIWVSRDHVMWLTGDGEGNRRR